MKLDSLQLAWLRFVANLSTTLRNGQHIGADSWFKAQLRANLTKCGGVGAYLEWKEKSA